MRGEEMEKTRAQIIGARLRDLRKEAGLSQKEVADAIGATPSAIGMYERGERVPNDENKVSLARLFDVDLMAVFYNGLDWGDTMARNTNKPLIQLIEESGRSLQAIAESLGLNRTALSVKLRGIRQFTPAELKLIVSELSITDPSEISSIFLAQ